MNDAPKRTSRPLAMLTLDGAVFPWKGAFPALCSMNGVDTLFWPFFDSYQKLIAFCSAVDLAFDDIKQVENSREFTAQFLDPDISDALKLIYNPVVTGPNKAVTYFEVIIGDAADVPPNPDPLAVS